MNYLLCFLGSYLLGSVPSGLILAKLFKVGDIRKIGSGNIGATNALRTGNKKLALMTLLFDMLKGALAVLIAGLFIPEYAIFAGFIAIIGHCFPIWLKFKGGKGVATAFGVLLAISPIVGLLVCLTWLGVFLISKISSLSALISMLSSVLYTYLLLSPKQAVYMVFIVILIYARHWQNIIRLIKGEEARWVKK